MNIYITKIPHARHRYEGTVGDWDFSKAPDDKHAHEFLDIKVSDLGNEDFEFLIGLHEMVEAWLCRKRGISGKAVTAFDEQFEIDREAELKRIGEVEDLVGVGEFDGAKERAAVLASEPGDHPAAPYHAEHIFATNIERRVAEELGVDFAAYERAIAEAK